MKKYLKLLLTVLFLAHYTNSIGQQLENKSTVIISETQLKSLVETLKKYKIQHAVKVDSIKKSSVLFLKNTKVDTQDSIVALKSDFEPVAIKKDSKLIGKISSEKNITNKNSLKSKSDLNKNEVIVNSDELLNLQNEIKELKIAISELASNQNSLKTIAESKPETIKEIRIIDKNNTIPTPIIIASPIQKTDTLYIVENTTNTKIIDSLLILKLQEKINYFEIKLKENDSILNSLKKNNITVVAKEQNKPLETHYNDILFENNIFELNIDNQNMLKQLAQLISTNKANHIYLKGYASNTGNSNYNKTLSLKRTESVKNFLIKNGVNAEKISSNYFGIDYSESNEAKARRVEITLFNN